MSSSISDRDLVRLYWPVELRPAFDALLDLDEAMADVVIRATQPALAAIKLAWWRERLEELDQGKVPAEPRLQAAASELLPRGIRGSDLAHLEEGWAALLEDSPDMGLLAERGKRLFELGARLLGVPLDKQIGDSGKLFAQMDAARRGLVGIPSANLLVGRSRLPKPARPLTGLAALAARDLKRGGRAFEPEGTPGRAWTLLRHRLTGRYWPELTGAGSFRT